MSRISIYESYRIICLYPAIVFVMDYVNRSYRDYMIVPGDSII